MKLKIKNLKLTASQKEAFDAIKDPTLKYYTLVWSRQSGKSTEMRLFCLQWLLSPKNVIGYITKNYKLGKTFYTHLVNLIPKAYIKSANGSDLIIETVFGSKIMFFSSESGDSIRGQTFTILIADEFAFYPNLSDFYHEILSPTVKVKGKKIIFVSTPFGKNLFYDFYLRGEEGKKGWFSMKKTIYDDGLVTEEQINEIRDGMPSKSFQQEYMCEFMDSGVSFFEGYGELFATYKYNDNIPQYIGIDPSSDGKDDFILTKINEKGQTKQYEITGTLDAKYIKCAQIINATKNLKQVLIEVNGVGKPIYNEIKKLCKNKKIIKEWTTTNESKVEILSDLAVAIVKQELAFEEGNTKLKSQFGTFAVKHLKSGKIQLMAQGSKHDDTILSLAFAHHCKVINSTSSKYNIKFGKKR